jgi:polyhydroxyalkanoate synthesis regulator phasin
MSGYEEGLAASKQRVEDLRGQLTELQVVMDEIPPAAEPVVHSLNQIDVAGLMAGESTKKLAETLRTEGKAAFEETRTVFETMAMEIERFGEVLKAGEISAETYGRAVQQSMLGAAQTTLSSVSRMTGMLASAFEDNKALAIANAVVKGGESIVSSFAEGSKIGGPPIGFLYAGIAAAATAAQIASIASATKNSRSLPGGGASGGATAPASVPQQQPGKAITVILQGDSYSKESVQNLIKQINEEQKDGHTINFEAG